MNHSYLMQHVSWHLHTIVKRFSRQFAELESFCGRFGFDDSCVFPAVLEYFCVSSKTAKANQEMISSKSADLTAKSEMPSAGSTVPAADSTIPSAAFPEHIPSDIPQILSVNGLIAYSLIPCPEFLYLVGPVRFTEPTGCLFETECKSIDSEWLDSVPFCHPDEFFSELLLIYNLYRDSVLSQDTLEKYNCVQPGTEEAVRRHFTSLIFEHQEYQKTHNPYDQEIREQTSIETGDIEGLKKSIAEDYPGELGILAKDRLRHFKNTAIVVITLASRSAMRGGLVPETAYSLSDSYIQKVESCRDIPTVMHLIRESEYHYTRLVREVIDRKAGLEKEKNPHIEKCKDYIFQHLHEKITVQEIADYLGVNANYLSGLFHECEGVTIRVYILREKITLVKNLLTYSPYSYIEIANYLGFSSQSYMGQQFKKITGCTLRQYRNKYGMTKFN